MTEKKMLEATLNPNKQQNSHTNCDGNKINTMNYLSYFKITYVTNRVREPI